MKDHERIRKESASTHETTPSSLLVSQTAVPLYKATPKETQKVTSEYRSPIGPAGRSQRLRDHTRDAPKYFVIEGIDIERRACGHGIKSDRTLWRVPREDLLNNLSYFCISLYQSKRER